MITREQMYTKLVAEAMARFQAELAGIPARLDNAIQQAEAREQTAQAVRNDLEAKKQFQERCSHHHWNGDTQFARVAACTGMPEYLYCQRCSLRVDNDHPRFFEWLAEAKEAEKAAIEEFASRQPVTPEEDALYALSLEELRNGPQQS